MTIHLRNLLGAITFGLLVTACGGGGGGDSDNDNDDPSPPAPTGFSLSGTVTASGSQAVDSDTNDPSREAVGNNTTGTAQPINNPVTLGGYLNQPRTGDPGRSFTSGDTEDFFVVDMLAGQVVTMLVADFETADADLYLWNESGQIVDFSVDEGEIEAVVAEEDGTYFINASSFRGATNYILALGAPDFTLTTESHRDIVPWQAVVKYREQPGATLDAAAMDRGIGLRQQSGGSGRPRLMELRRDPASRQQRIQALQGMQGNKRHTVAAAKHASLADPALRARWETLLAIKSLRGDPMVEYAEPNFRVWAQATPNDEAYPLQWHYPLIGLPDAWDTTTGSAEVVVAVVDTGVLPTHPDLAGQLVDGYDFVSDPANAGDGGGIDPDPRDPGGSFGGGAGTFHGTHVAGTVAARGDNGRGGAGVAYSARIMPLRVLGVDGGGTTYDVDQAMRYAAGLANDSGTTPGTPAAIINLSLGGAPFSQASQDLVDELRAAGVILVAAAGNEAGTQPSYPAAFAGVISVSAVDTQRSLAPYSNTGSTVDVAAPGGNSSVDLNGDGYPDGVLSTAGTQGEDGINFVYAFISGTSMATPHVAGVLALMKSINPALTPEDIDALLMTGDLTDDLGPPGRDDSFGYGLINARSAVAAALVSIGASPADIPRLLVSATTLNFGASTTALGLTFSNGGQGELELESIDASAPWLQVSAQDVDAAGLGDYTVSVDRSGLPPGIFAADITARSSINTLTIRVYVSVAGVNAAPDVGVVYILLYDVVLDDPVAQVAANGNGGEYRFLFENIEPGSYEILAGSDADNDLFICDAGEACGAWLTTDQPILIELEEDLSGLDFPVEWQVSIPSLAGAGARAATPPQRELLRDLAGKPE